MTGFLPPSFLKSYQHHFFNICSTYLRIPLIAGLKLRESLTLQVETQDFSTSGQAYLRPSEKLAPHWAKQEATRHDQHGLRPSPFPPHSSVQPAQPGCLPLTSSVAAGPQPTGGVRGANVHSEQNVSITQSASRAITTIRPNIQLNTMINTKRHDQEELEADPMNHKDTRTGRPTSPKGTEDIKGTPPSLPQPRATPQVSLDLPAGREEALPCHQQP